MKVVMKTEVVITEEREMEVTQVLCNSFCKKVAKEYEAEFEPITLEEIEKYDNGEESNLDQVMAIEDGKEVLLADLWKDWISDTLCDCGVYYEVDREYINDEIRYEAI